MSLRKLLRIVLSVVVLAMFLPRVAQQWRYESSWRLFGSLMLAALLFVLLVLLVSSTFRKPRRARDEVPKRPLGLDG
jgi:hypothetical protein